MNFSRNTRLLHMASSAIHLHDAIDPHVAPFGKLHNHIADGQLKFRLTVFPAVPERRHKGSGALCSFPALYTERPPAPCTSSLRPSNSWKLLPAMRNIAYGLDLKLSDSPSAGRVGEVTTPKSILPSSRLFDGFRVGALVTFTLILDIPGGTVPDKEEDKTAASYRWLQSTTSPHPYIQHPLQHLPRLPAAPPLQALHSGIEAPSRVSCTPLEVRKNSFVPASFSTAAQPGFTAGWEIH